MAALALMALGYVLASASSPGESTPLPPWTPQLGPRIHDPPRVVLELIDGRAALPILPRDQRVELNAGRVDALGLQRPQLGRLVRWRNDRGAFLVWTLRFSVFHAGRSARLEAWSEGLDPTPLRYAVGEAERWNSKDAGQPLPSVGVAVLHPALSNRDTVIVEVAAPVPDEQTPGLRHPCLQYRLVVEEALP